MKVQVLRSAIEDLAAGRKFYDRQETGVGDYFFDSLFAEIDSPAAGKAFSLRHLLQGN
ncbi:hypothetical protein [Methylobacter sp.]|uniref:hypothetical protein n=1 Tax=Methylobacter sp. TaxID=2051955 RepID=UPI0026141B7A|nr:hypothetical protein [Methylobacter sp.]